jgi:hypothetical protein
MSDMAHIHLHNNGEDLTIEHVRHCLDYCCDTGVFRWSECRSNAAPKGSIAGSLHKRGYVCIQLDGTIYRAHRLAWFYVYGGWPAGDLDHINGVKSDNRIANLRVATASQNQANVGRRIDNKSGYKGVSFHKLTQKWSATIQHQGKRIHLGLFATPEGAAAAYVSASKPLHGQFARVA